MFLTHLAAQQAVAAATQNQALNALLFLYGVTVNSAMTFSSDAPTPASTYWKGGCVMECPLARCLLRALNRSIHS